MSWFRDRMKFGVQAALAALLIQFVASFVHLHLDHIGAQASVVNAVTANHTARGHQQSDGDFDHETGICDVCATLLLIASAQLSLPPVLPIPAPRYAMLESCLFAPALPDRSHVHFRSRAPPTV
jgi:hypothetical protein